MLKSSWGYELSYFLDVSLLCSSEIIFKDATWSLKNLIIPTGLVRWHIAAHHQYKGNILWAVYACNGRYAVVSIDLGYSGTGEISVAGCGVLQGSWLLCSCVWCHNAKHIQIFGQLEGRIPHPGQSQGPRKFPICCYRK